jgi:hydroxyacylglutathione hydrolase
MTFCDARPIRLCHDRAIDRREDLPTMTKPALEVAIVPVTPFAQNCAIVVHGPTRRAAIVDPGGDVPRIVEAIAKLGVTPERIWLTHGHIDHAGGAAELKETLGGIAIEGPDARDKFLLDGLPEKGLEYGMTTARVVTPDRWLAEGDELKLGDLRFQVLHVPGHTPGSVVFFDAENRFALVGDTLFKGSVGRTDMPYGDHDALVGGIRSKLLTLGDDVSFLCGHGPHGTIGEERVSNPFVGDR